MIRKLPRWIEVGGFCLAAVAGAVNAIGLLGFQHHAVSHLTGTSTLFSLALVDGDLTVGLHLVMIILSFVGGAIISGAITGNVALQLGRRYSIALLVESGLLVLAMIALGSGHSIGQLLASAACGLQNGMVSTYSGAIIRTTHVTGLFTDIGTMIGARWRGHELDRRRLVLYLILVGGFVVGGAIGAYGYEHAQFMALGIPVAATTALSVAYWMYNHRRTR